jgi:hypothetical protein
MARRLILSVAAGFRARVEDESASPPKIDEQPQKNAFKNANEGGKKQ